MIGLGLVAALYAAVATTPAPQTDPVPTPTPVDAPAALPWTWSVNEEGVFRSWEDNADTANREDLMDGMNRLIGVVTRGGFETGAQLDIA